MSGEFREITGSHFLHEALRNFSDEGTHEVSQALTKLYRAVAPVERACAWNEADDCGPGHPYSELIKSISGIGEAFYELKKISGKIEDLIRDLKRDGSF